MKSFNELISEDRIEIKPLKIKKTKKGIIIECGKYSDELEFGLKQGDKK